MSVNNALLGAVYATCMGSKPKKAQSVAALFAVLVLLGLRRMDITDKTHGPETDLRARWKTKVLRIIGTEVDQATVAQNERQTGKHLVFGKCMLPSAKVLELIRAASAVMTGRDLPHFEGSVAKRAHRFLHGA